MIKGSIFDKGFWDYHTLVKMYSVTSVSVVEDTETVLSLADEVQGNQQVEVMKWSY